MDKSFNVKIIKKQIKNKLAIMNDQMNVTCFDIKPLNTVINYEIDQKSNVINIDVRLIDWDADFCIKFNVNKSLLNTSVLSPKIPKRSGYKDPMLKVSKIT